MTMTDRNAAKIAKGSAELDTRAQERAGTESGPTMQGMEGDPILPMQVHGPEVSYFTGKLEAVLRFKELAYQRVAQPPGPGLERTTGVAQVPGVQLADRRWITDTTPIIAWLDERYPEPSVIPRQPVVAFFSRLLEDYADEWLWRPAMHYRWDYPQDAHHLSRILADELTGEVSLPGFIKRNFIRGRQRALFTTGDGVGPATWDHVEKIYLDSLAHLRAILKTRPYLLGTRPSLADFGFFGPMFRHFGHDPTGSSIMRETAPEVYEWVARVWNARASVTGGELLGQVPDDWGPILDSIGSAYLPYLCANAEAWKAGRSHFDVDIEGAPYRRIRTARYRVWCLEELRRHFGELVESDQREVRTSLEAHGCWEPLWSVESPESGIDPQREAPFSPGHSATGVGSGEAAKRRWVPVATARRSQ